MALAVKNNYEDERRTDQLEIRKMVLAGMEDAKQGRVKDLDEVCDRLIKKYQSVNI